MQDSPSAASTYKIMPNAFEILAGFLEHFGDEVEGRESPAPPPEVSANLRALAQGNLSEAEQSRLFSQLHQNPRWVRHLAEEVKALRRPPDGPKG